MASHINDLQPQVIQAIFSQLEARDLASASLVQRQWRDAAADDRLWAPLLKKDWAQEAAVGPDWTAVPSSREAYGAWMRQLGDFPDPSIMLEVVRAWTTIRAWLAQHFPAVLSTLNPGATRDALDAAGQALGAPLPLPLQALYRVHDGQLLWWDAKLDLQHGIPGAEAAVEAALLSRRDCCSTGLDGAGGSSGAQAGSKTGDPGAGPGEEGLPDSSIFHGLFGGYSFYDHMVVNRMLPLSRAVWWSVRLRSQLVLASQSLERTSPPCMLVVASFNLRRKMIIDLSTANILVNCSRAFIPAAPSAPAPGDDTNTGEPTGLLAWFCEYSRRLAAGWYQVEPIDQEFPNTQAVSLFPRAAPGLVEAVTRGVVVGASVVYAPEASLLSRHLFTYSIRFRLQSEAQQQAALEAGGSTVAVGFGASRPPRPVQRCQLLSRHWRIRDEEGNLEDEVVGQGVIGKYPELVPGGPEFSYQSCTHQARRKGYMEGEFKFVEGTIGAPTGPQWDVVCPRFELSMPDFIF